MLNTKEEQEVKDVPVFYCPKCGEKRLRQLSAKKFVCEREHCQFTAYKNAAAAVAAIIEVKEELGLQIRDPSYLSSFPNKYPYKGIEYSTVDSVFVCKPDSMDVKREEGEIEGWEIFDPEVLNLEDVAFKSIRKALEQYLEFIQQRRNRQTKDWSN